MLGSTRPAVRALLGDEAESFKRTESSEWPCDYFARIGIFVYYRAPGVVEAIELCRPASAIVDSLDLLRVPILKAIEHLKGLDPDLEVAEDSFTSYKLGVGGYAPDMDDPNSEAESIIVFRPGYYDA